MVAKTKDHSELQYWCPRVQKTKKWKSSHTGNRSYQLTSAGQSAHGWQIGRHWLAGKSFFPCGRIFSEPLGITIEGLNSSCLGSNCLFEFNLTGCVLPSFVLMLSTRPVGRCVGIVFKCMIFLCFPKGISINGFLNTIAIFPTTRFSHLLWFSAEK